MSVVFRRRSVLRTDGPGRQPARFFGFWQKVNTWEADLNGAYYFSSYTASGSYSRPLRSGIRVMMIATRIAASMTAPV